MGNVKFAVSAKTARLIGRENISDVDGAIIELVKNSYDADATCVLVLFNMPFPSTPQTIPYTTIKETFGEDIANILQYYKDDGEAFKKKDKLSASEEEELSELLCSKNSITVIDNGSGMDEQTLTSAWMNIGTNDKEERRISPKGRIKTGAKGIGRFALDKLSKATTVYTKSDNDSLKKWQIDWQQFETASLLSEVSASLDNCEGCFTDYVSRLTQEQMKGIDGYDWKTGTIIQLTPTREPWSNANFGKIGKTLRSLFPWKKRTDFDIFVFNKYFPAYNYLNERFSFDETEYDYKIIGTFDGQDQLSIEITRNEIDTRKIKATRIVNSKEVSLIFNDFWSRDAFKKPHYGRSDFAKKVKRDFSASSLTKIDPSILESVGPFDVELYFLKNTPSPIEIVKPVNGNNRKSILEQFSGIKLYRDGFKVRPYGDPDGPSFDWLSLGVRAQKSPAAISHDAGSWRVRSNQIIGAVRITREGNPNLMDKANREGLAINDAYQAFVALIDKILETFEADRQYVFREYLIWRKEKEATISETSQILEEAKKSHHEDSKENKGKNASSSKDSEKYVQAILDLEAQRRAQEQAAKTLMLYSSSGVMTNTFSHEISRIMTQAGSRMQQLRYSINRTWGEYTGNPLFNPYEIIHQAEDVDKLLESWIEVLMRGTGGDVLVKKPLNLYSAISEILSAWGPLLRKKLITAQPVELVGSQSDCEVCIAEIDILIVMNNFLLNSAYFLEKATNQARVINVKIIAERSRTTIELVNNGPPLDGQFANNPDRIFDAGVSTKITENGQGSGVGLWITKTLISNNSGTIHPMDMNDGFGLQIILPK